MDLGAKPKLTAEQRIAQRWNRVQGRLAAKLSTQNGDDQNAKDLNSGGNADDSVQQSQTKVQIRKSRDAIDEIAQSIHDNVNDIKLTSEIRAATRRHKVESEYESRMYRLEQCIERGRELNAGIDEEWAALHRRKNPQALYAGIEGTKLKCKALISGYESTRKQFMSEFKKKSEQYVALLKSQENDVTEMIWRMHDSIKSVKDEYETQIIEVEKAFMHERRDIIEENQTVLDALFDKRAKQEFLILERKVLSNAKYHDDLEKVRREDQESYNKLKINLENHIQLLEQQLEEMRAMYQLNTEKLNYNFQVLKEREKENITTVDHLKRREKKLKESVGNIKEKFNKLDAKFKEDHKVLHDEYHRVTKQYKELQRKFKHFQQTDTVKYDEICDMNRREAVALLDNIMKCDQIICTQLLGIEWRPYRWQIPLTLTKELHETLNNQFHTANATDFLQFQSDRTSVADAEIDDVLSADTAADDKALHVETDAADEDAPTSAGLDDDEDVDAAESKEDGSTATANDDTDTGALSAKMASARFSTEEIMLVMKLLIAEAPFLIAGAIKDSLHYIPAEQQLLYQCDSILKSLGIEDIEDLEELVALFIADGQLSVQPFQTIAIVKKFVSDRDHTKTADIHATNFSVKHALTSASREKQERRKRKDQEYWKTLQGVFPKNNKKIWGLLEKYLVKYNKVLEQRKREAVKIATLQNENSELRQLLQQYLSSDANKELIIPPSLIIDAQQQQQ